MANFMLDLPEDLHRKLRIKKAKEDIDIKDIIIDAIRNELKQEAKE